MSFTGTVKQWSEDVRVGSLLLPDGWYGRPYDNQHTLTSVEESGGALTIVLDRRLTLRFEGLESVIAQEKELVFGPFRRLRFDWVGVGADGSRGTKEYQAGEARVVMGP